MDSRLNTSKTISYLRFPLIVGVVFGHFNLARDGMLLHEVRYGLNNPDWFNTIVYLLSMVLPMISLLLFFLISGFLFFYRKDFNATIYRQKLRTRVKTLVVPFFLWNIIAILIAAARKLPFLSSVFPNAYKTSIIITPERLFHTFFANFPNEGIFVTSGAEDAMTVVSYSPFPIDAPLWYVRELMVMVIFAPLIYWLIKKCGSWFIMLLGAIWYIIPILLPDGGYVVLFFTAAFFFSWGAYFSINKLSFVNEMRQARYMPLLFLLLAVADVMTKSTDYNELIYQACLFVGVMSAVGVTSRWIERGRAKMNMALADCTFFIFALHSLIMHDLAKMIFTVFHLSDNTLSMIFLYFAVPTITIILCVLINLFLKRFLPPVSHLLTGGR